MADVLHVHLPATQTITTHVTLLAVFAVPYCCFGEGWKIEQPTVGNTPSPVIQHRHDVMFTFLFAKLQGKVFIKHVIGAQLSRSSRFGYNMQLSRGKAMWFLDRNLPCLF